jgi:acyl-CoA dehydrogenase
MNYDLSDAHRGLQAEMGKFCRGEIASGAALLDEAPPDVAAAQMRVNLNALAGAGYQKLLLTEDRLGSCVAGEELARVCPATFLAAMTSTTAFGRAVRRFGTKHQQERYLPSLTAGERIAAFACTEAEAGSDLAGMGTTAEHQDGRWVLRGEKDLVTNAPLAGSFLVLAWTDRDAGKEKGLSLFFIDCEAEGMTIGKPVETMGLRGAPTSGIRLEGCEATAEALLGGTAGAGWGQMQSVFEEINLALSTMCVGIGVACMEEATCHAKGKKAFGKPVGLFEGVGAKLATMFTFNDIGRMMTCRAAWAMDQCDPEAPVLASCAKLFTSEAVGRIADLAMQVHGGHGYLKSATVERLCRDARFAVIAWGTSEMQRAFIAKDSLDRFRAA